MSTSQERPSAMPRSDLPIEPLTEAEARHAEVEALQRTVESNPETIESRRRGRLEAETRRISEEVTRQAQERLRQERARRERLAEPTSGMDETETEIETLGAEEVTSPGRGLPEPTTIEQVLLALDGTSYAERSLPYALALATHTHASILIAHVQEDGSARTHTVLAKALATPTKEAPVRDVQEVAKYLNAIRVRAASSVPRVETVTLSADTAADGLVALLARTHADVVVLATHARHGLERRILGSVGDTLIQLTHVPLLLIPPGMEVSAVQAPTFQRILVPLDGSVVAEQALAPVLTLAKSFTRNSHGEMEIVLYHVVESRVTRPEGVRYVQDVRERLRRMELPATISITAAVMVGSPPGSITSAAIHGVVTEPTYPRRFDLVAMATHGRGGFQRWLLGSVAEYLLAHVSVPMLLVRPEQTDI